MELDFYEFLALISIHAPREGCDIRLWSTRSWVSNFNPRTPRGVRPPANLYFFGPLEFQSTHPARGATICFAVLRSANPISIHAPREGCDSKLY